MTFVGLACLAGLPAILGTVAGATVSSPQWIAVAFGLGAGAIAQIVIEVSAYLVRLAAKAKASWLTPASVLGSITGLVLM